ncbi:hypothetical protein ACFW04_006618 [Cataglyphis niger]
MKHQGVIEESQSPCVSLAVMVRKKDGSIRLCVDYRKLNAVTFAVMPFGLCNAPATFKRLMEKVLKELLFNICLVYLDNVIIFGERFKDMLSRLRQDFSQLRSVNLKLNPRKCSFFKEIKYLGHVVSQQGVTTNPEKIATVENWPIPQTKKQVRSFLGFCSYYIIYSKDHLEDSIIVKILCGKKKGQHPSWQEIVLKGSSTKIYWSQWDSLELRDGILFRKWESPSMKSCVSQIIFPKKRFIMMHHPIVPDTSPVTCKQDVKDCRSYRVCIAKKGSSDKERSEMQIYNARVPFERIQVDVVGPFPTSSSGIYIYILYIYIFIILKNVRAKTVAKTFVNQVISRFGIPSEVHVGQRRNFDLRLFRELSHFLGIKKTRTTPFHLQSNDLFVADNQRDWDRWIGICLLAYRSARYEIIGVSLESCFGRGLKLPLDLLRSIPSENEVNLSEGSLVSKLRGKLNEIHDGVRRHQNMKSLRSKAFYFIERLVT